ncbi:MAG: hypothetical protein NZM00_01200, partial [Anaerolinea sp.]|nr:hypothetical protein [Anaerolinea sp.]
MNIDPGSIPRKYTRPRRVISIWGVVIGLVLGIGAGFYFAREVNPLPETDVQPWQLTEDDQIEYIAAVALAFAYDSDVNRAVARLLELRLPGDPIQAVADLACELATTAYVSSSHGLRAVQAMIQFYRLQGRSGCADMLISAPLTNPTRIVNIQLPTATPAPSIPPTKTPNPEELITPTPLPLRLPTTPPQGDFELLGVSTLCSAARPGMIEVLVYEANGATGVPGIGVRARWSGGESLFFTGLLPERGPGFADFQMEPGYGYLIDLPGRPDQIA